MCVSEWRTPQKKPTNLNIDEKEDYPTNEGKTVEDEDETDIDNNLEDLEKSTINTEKILCMYEKIPVGVPTTPHIQNTYDDNIVENI